MKTLLPILSKIFQTTEKEAMSPPSNSFYEASKPLKLKPGKYIIKEKNYR